METTTAAVAASVGTAPMAKRFQWVLPIRWDMVWFSVVEAYETTGPTGAGPGRGKNYGRVRPWRCRRLPQERVVHAHGRSGHAEKALDSVTTEYPILALSRSRSNPR
ncbi:hypothetical protein GCM10010350_02160 [Streptomyces galilaeus]|nr:hypothetical protein GCM10010350_02160 [Streptomyces galilaeus]